MMMRMEGGSGGGGVEGRRRERVGTRWLHWVRMDIGI